MGIKFDCVHCGRRINVKSFLAGKRGICPHCQGKVDIPGDDDDAQAGARTMPRAVAAQPTATGAAVSDPRHAAGGASSDGPVLAPAATSAAIARPAVGVATPARGTSRGAIDSIDEAPQLHWYVLPSGSMTKYGPAVGPLMRTWIEEGRVSGDAMVWREGWPQWRVAATVFPQLAASTSPTGAQQSAPSLHAGDGQRGAAGAAETPVQLQAEDSPRWQKRRRPRSKRLVATVALILVFLCLLPVVILVLINQ